MNICIFGSSSKKTPKEFTSVGYDLGLKLADDGHSLIFGGGDDGMMGATVKGVYDNGGRITAIAPHWIDEFDVEFENSDELIETDTINERKDLFLEKSDLFIVCPGGLGTLDEFFDCLALKYLKRHSKQIILFNINHFYDTMLLMLDEFYEKCVIPDGALDFFDVATSVEEVFELIY